MMSRGHSGKCICSCYQDAWGKFDNDFDYEELAEPGAYPYFGKNTMFYGEDAESRGLKTRV